MTRIAAIICTVLLSSAAFVPGFAFGATDTGKLIAEGKTLLELGQYEEAQATFRRILAEDPENVEALLYLQETGVSEPPPATGEQPAVNGQPSTIPGQPPEESVQQLEEVGVDPGVNPTEPDDGSALELESEPEPFRGHEDMVVPVPFEEQVSTESQEEQVERPEPAVPDSPRRRLQYYYRKGLEEYEAKNYPEAIHSFEKVQELETGYRRADYYRRESWNRLADQQWEGKGEERAEEQPKGKESYDAYARGKEYMRYGRYEAAIQEFQTVLDREPDHQGARALQEEARLKLEKTAFEDEVAAAEQL
ncbi:MAG: tetratricopeptide repeat protein, partial [PVC group bacterium]